MNMHPDLLTDKYRNAEDKTYTSIHALHHATGLNKKVLSRCKHENMAGFQTNSNVNLKLLREPLEKVYTQYMAELENKAPSQDIKHYKTEIAKRDVTLRDLQIKKLERNMLEPEDVKKMLIELATLQSITINNIMNELPPRLVGLAEGDIRLIIEQSTALIYKVIKEKIDGI